MGRAMNANSGYCKEVQSIWREEIKSWFGWGGNKQTLTTIFLTLVSIYLLAKGGDFDLANEEISVRIATLAAGLFWLIIITLISYIQANKLLYKKYKDEYETIKRRADKSNWIGIEVSFLSFKEGEQTTAYLVCVKNNKHDAYHFFIELQYLEVDGKAVSLQEQGKSRILLWASGGLNTAADGTILDPRDDGKKIGRWDLLKVDGGGQSRRFKIVSAELDNHGKQSRLPDYYIKDYARGELRLDAKHIERTLSTGAAGSGKPYVEIIRGNLVYKFRIDINNNEPQMTVFEEGQLEYYSDQELQKL